MRNFMNGISKGLAFVLAAAMVFTSVPSPVLADTLSLDTAVESDELTDAASVVDASAEISDSQVATDGDLIDSGIEVAAETADAADLEATTGGEEVNVDTADARQRIMLINGATDPADGKFYLDLTDDSSTNALDYGETVAAGDITIQADALEADDVTPGSYNPKTPYTKARFELLSFAANKGVANIQYTHTGTTHTHANAITDATANAALVDTTKTPVLPDGLTFKDNENGTYSITGIAKQVGTFSYALRVYDSENTTNPSLYYGIKLEVKPLSGGPNDVATLYKGATPLTDPSDTQGLVFIGEAGYTVVDTTPLPNSKQVQSQQVVIKTDITSDAALAENDLEFTLTTGINTPGQTEEAGDYDDGEASTDFVWTKTYTDSSKNFDSAKPITLTISPKTGLVAKSTPYVAYLHIRSKKAMGQWKENELVLKLSFNVRASINVFATVGGEVMPVRNATFEFVADDIVGAEAVAKGYYKKSSTDYVPAVSTDASGTNFYKKTDVTYLGAKPFGTYFDDVVINASGGAGTLRVEWPEQTGMGTFGIDTQKKVSGENKWQICGAADPAIDDGATSIIDANTLYTVHTDGETYKPIDTDLIGTIFSVVVKDTAGNDEEQWYYMDAAYADQVTYSINGTKLELSDGTTAGTYVASFAWDAAKDATLDDSYATLTISNAAIDDFEVTGAIIAKDGTDPAGRTITPGTETEATITFDKSFADVKVEGTDDKTAPNTVTIKLMPGDDNGVIRRLSLSGKGLATTVIDLVFDKADDDIAIVSPEANASVAGLTDAQLGKTYNYKFSAVKSSTLSDIKWSVMSDVQVNALKTANNVLDGVNPTGNKWYVNGTEITTNAAITGTTAGATLSPATTEELKKWFGLEIDPDTGILSGTMIPGIDPTSLNDPKDPYKTRTDSDPKKFIDYVNSTNGKGVTFEFFVVAQASATGGNYFAVQKVNLGAIEPDDAILVKSSDIDVLGTATSTGKIDLASLEINNEEGASASVNVKNVTGLKLTGAQATITKVERKVTAGDAFTTVATDAADVVDYFTLSPAGTDPSEATSAVNIKANESADFVVKTLKPVKTRIAGTNELIPGIYRATIKIDAGNLGASSFTTDGSFTFPTLKSVN